MVSGRSTELPAARHDSLSLISLPVVVSPAAKGSDARNRSGWPICISRSLAKGLGLPAVGGLVAGTDGGNARAGCRCRPCSGYRRSSGHSSREQHDRTVLSIYRDGVNS